MEPTFRSRPLAASAAYVRGGLENAEFAAAEAGLLDDAALPARAQGAVGRLADHQRTDR
ncbi:hypothetical protein ACFXPA_04820 [Amycolatopsis sp. NPDC059090]|uniref:hypothetical protein n=1 Tax=unclassified Amycolatopsis TaxID=2618356 RepID=UPI00366B4ED4